MRLWSVHPRYLDRQGLTAGWREGLLAQKVLTGTTRGYRNHPQLIRFRVDAPPSSAGEVVQEDQTGHDGHPPGAPITTYLHHLVDEAERRGYHYDRTKVLAPRDPALQLEVTRGQLLHEWAHLRGKLATRSPEVLARWSEVAEPDPHPLFVVVGGPVADWEVLTDARP